jgi:acyl transferase domain-containing protein
MHIHSNTSMPSKQNTTVVNGAKEIRNGPDGVNGVKGINGVNKLNGVNGAPTGSTGATAPSISATGHNDDPIVIIGMGMRLPGGVTDAPSLWNLLIEKRDGCRRVPEDRYNIDAFYSGPEQKRGLVPVEYANFLQDLNLKHLDTSVFRLTRPEAEFMDPQQRLLLEVTREALENAGETQWRGKSIGCWIGTLGDDFANLHGLEDQDLGSEAITIYADFLQANRVSYEFDFQGPR